MQFHSGASELITLNCIYFTVRLFGLGEPAWIALIPSYYGFITGSFLCLVWNTENRKYSLAAFLLSITLSLAYIVANFYNGIITALEVVGTIVVKILLTDNCKIRRRHGQC